MRARSAIAGLLLLTVAGCGNPVLAPTAAPTTAPVSVSTVVNVEPTALSFPAIGVTAPLVATGLDSTGAIAVPPLDEASQVDYLNWAPAIAAGRPTVLVSHVNGRYPNGTVMPGGFIHLGNAKVGETVTVSYSDKRTTTFRVDRVSLVSKSAFPTSVYDPSPTPSLLLVTCGGALDEAADSYLSNWLIHAVAA